MHLIITRFPLIYPDSKRYLSMAVNGHPLNVFAPTLVSWMLGPLCHFIGAWAFAAFQIVLLSYALATFLEYFRMPLFLGVAAILCSAAGFMATAVMMDIYTAIGLISLFLILSGKKNLLLFIILGICFAAHYGNMLLFGAMSVLCFWLSQSKKRRVTWLAVAIVFLTAYIGIMLINLSVPERLKYRDWGPYSTVAGRIMRTFPDLISSYADKYPDSLIAHDRLYLEMESQRPLQLELKRTKAMLRHDEAWRFLLFSVSDAPGRMTHLAMRNTFDFLLFPDFQEALVRNQNPLRSIVGSFLPQQLPQIQGSLQDRNRLGVINRSVFYKISYAVAMFTLAGYLLCTLVFPRMRKKIYFGFVFFSFIALLCNAIICSNLILTVYRFICGRHQVRILLVPYLAAALILADYANEYFKKFALFMEQYSAKKKH